MYIYIYVYIYVYNVYINIYLSTHMCIYVCYAYVYNNLVIELHICKINYTYTYIIKLCQQVFIDNAETQCISHTSSAQVLELRS